MQYTELSDQWNGQDQLMSASQSGFSHTKSSSGPYQVPFNGAMDAHAQWERFNNNNTHQASYYNAAHGMSSAALYAQPAHLAQIQHAGNNAGTITDIDYTGGHQTVRWPSAPGNGATVQPPSAWRLQ